eukprot:CAMPEP_0117434112 /NCGR_PEP_ID=MMETSP0758-20121206/13398_1 /TAXON_ID=63605 /ORGANISM="Percolomonas cosmopolitus, Strain AE-1 (ATCC 50343)" /LENGTH=447 /DNA_ID=CAMNT_0005225299 /DNA_START=1167 /DNA_END=2507 /DNA_ORIENTATION=-
MTSLIVKVEDQSGQDDEDDLVFSLNTLRANEFGAAKKKEELERLEKMKKRRVKLLFETNFYIDILSPRYSTFPLTYSYAYQLRIFLADDRLTLNEDSQVFFGKTLLQRMPPGSNYFDGRITIDYEDSNNVLTLCHPNQPPLILAKLVNMFTIKTHYKQRGSHFSREIQDLNVDEDDTLSIHSETDFPDIQDDHQGILPEKHVYGSRKDAKRVSVMYLHNNVIHVPLMPKAPNPFFLHGGVCLSHPKKVILQYDSQLLIKLSWPTNTPFDLLPTLYHILGPLDSTRCCYLRRYKEKAHVLCNFPRQGLYKLVIRLRDRLSASARDQEGVVYWIQVRGGGHFLDQKITHFGFPLFTLFGSESLILHRPLSRFLDVEVEHAFKIQLQPSLHPFTNLRVVLTAGPQQDEFVFYPHPSKPDVFERSILFDEEDGSIQTCTIWIVEGLNYRRA